MVSAGNCGAFMSDWLDHSRITCALISPHCHIFFFFFHLRAHNQHADYSGAYNYNAISLVRGLFLHFRCFQSNVSPSAPLDYVCHSCLIELIFILNSKSADIRTEMKNNTNVSQLDNSGRERGQEMCSRRLGVGCRPITDLCKVENRS